MALAIVAAARARGMALPVPADIKEVPEEGVAARVGGRSVIVSGRDFVMSGIGVPVVPNNGSDEGAAIVSVAVDGQHVGNLILADPLQAETAFLGLDVAGRSRRIALESVVMGIGLSMAGMIAAALGYLTPVQSSPLQEVIDVAVILNALRALRISSDRPQRGTEPLQTAAIGHVP